MPNLVEQPPLRKHYDVIVIGAGINGAGVARDAAMRGLKVLILDKGDIASGTSSVSTRLIHGGLRYLEHGEFGLVRESLRERQILLHIASHLVKPLSILLPIYRYSKRGRLKIRIGMFAYDALSNDKLLTRHSMLSALQTLEQEPGLARKDLVGAAVYCDGQVEFAERLVLENVLSAAEHGAAVRTYHRVDKLSFEAAQTVSINVSDLLMHETCVVSASMVVNAAGPWVDQLLAKAIPTPTQLIGGTKGSHIVVKPFQGAPKTALYIEARADHRPFFIIPWNNLYLLGTTEVRFSDSPDEARIDANEVEYLLNETNNLFPQAHLDKESILFTFCGVRPLAFVSGKDEQSITRRHFLCESPGLISIVGGKLTTYRKVAEETVDLLAKRLGRRVSECRTAEIELPGAVDFASCAEHFRLGTNLPAKTTERLIRIYGSRAQEIARLAELDSNLNKVIDEESGGIAAEVVFAVRHEFARTLSDVLVRRTLWAFSAKGVFEVAEKAAAVCAAYFEWSADRVAKELRQFRDEMRTRHSVPD
jgi:glycerol-3-phosphate dehydrogenase